METYLGCIVVLWGCLDRNFFDRSNKAPRWIQIPPTQSQNVDQVSVQVVWIPVEQEVESAPWSSTSVRVRIERSTESGGWNGLGRNECTGVIILDEPVILPRPSLISLSVSTGTPDTRTSLHSTSIRTFDSSGNPLPIINYS